jgi:predicted  nucleic acid-binding Zn-ribbon protein
MIGQYELERIERTANEARNRLHELDTLRRDVDNLEHSLREARAVADGLRDELRSTEERMNHMEVTIQEILANVEDTRRMGASPFC